MTVKFLVIFRINIQVRFCNFDVSDTFHTYRDTSEKEAFLNFLKKLDSILYKVVASWPSS